MLRTPRRRNGVLTGAVPALATARPLTDSFMEMVRNGRGEDLEPWRDDAEKSLLDALTRGLRRDQAAVAAALREPLSNRRTVGQISLLKTLKRQMDYRANNELHKARLVEVA